MLTNKPTSVIKIDRPGSPSTLKLTTEIIGDPNENQVLIRQKSIALNFVDVIFRNGTFPIHQFPATIGVEAAGIVEAIGKNVTTLAVGDRVGYYFNLGAYAEFRLMNAHELIKIPAHISFDQAASIMAKGLTARMLIKQAYRVKKGDTILVHAAAGGVGSLICKWAKSLGAKVIGTVGNSSKKAYALSNGIDYVIALDTENLAEKVKLITQNKGVQALYDGVGQATFNQSLDLIANGGSAILFGTSSGAPKIDFPYLESKKITFVNPNLGQYLPNTASLNQAVDELFEALKNGSLGEIHPTIYSLSDAAIAHQDLESGKTTGSVIFHINN